MSARRTQVLLLALALLGLGLVGLVGLYWIGGAGTGASPAVPSAGAPPPPRPAAAELATPPAAESLQVVETPPLVQRLLCLSATDRSPIAGVQLYAQAHPVAGPSAEDGLMVVPDSVHSQRLHAWAPGWAPASLPTRWPLPEEVLLEPATAGVQVRVRTDDSAVRITRTRLVRVGTPTREDQPWVPRLHKQGALSAGAGQLPAGAYHLYVWVAGEDRAPRALPRQEVELVAGRTLPLELDADAPREGEPDG